jgi:NAD(P)-dependent dehydrogenase (short-subunit alcohol dehydrogenase family)
MINLAGDLRENIRVNCVAPGAIISADWEAEHFASVLEKVPMGRSGKPIDIANSVKFLLESDHLSGQIINVDGGWTIVE